MLLVLLPHTHAQLLYIKLFTIPIPNIHIHSLPLSPFECSSFGVRYSVFHFYSSFSGSSHATQHLVKDSETLLLFFFISLFFSNSKDNFCEVSKI